MRLGGERTLLPYTGIIRIPGLQAVEARQISVMAMQLRDELLHTTGARWNVAKGAGWSPAIELVVDDTLPNGSYHLLITAHGPSGIPVLAAGGDVEGLRFAVQTLRQLLRQYGASLPILEINDHPSMRERALSYDISRGRVPTLDGLKGLVDELCLFKYNQLQLYIEHTINLDDSSEAWSGQDPLTSDDILQLDDYCDDRGIELVPAIATFGHMYDILRTHQYRHLGEHPEMAGQPFSFVERMLHHTFNPTDPEAINFVMQRMDACSSLFRSRRINIGADETFDLGTGRSRQEADERGTTALYVGYVRRLCAHAERRGLQPVMYADIALRHPEMLERLPDTVALANWDYARYPSEANIERISHYGYTQYVCPGVQTWNRLLPDLDAAWTNISSMCSYGHRHGAAGMIVTDWGDYGHINDPVMSVPGMLYASECSWNEQVLERKEIDLRANVLGFVNRGHTMIDAIVQASRAQTFGWADIVQYKELDEQGSLNTDIAQMLGQPVDESLEQSRTRFLDDRRAQIKRARECDEILERCEFLCAVASAEETGRDGTAMTVRLMVAGQRILNRIGTHLAENQDGHSDDSLAYDIERWRSAYEHRWRSISTQSGLGRIGDVLGWYASLCRTGDIADVRQVGIA